MASGASINVATLRQCVEPHPRRPAHADPPTPTRPRRPAHADSPTPTRPRRPAHADSPTPTRPRRIHKRQASRRQLLPCCAPTGSTKSASRRSSRLCPAPTLCAQSIGGSWQQATAPAGQSQCVQVSRADRRLLATCCRRSNNHAPREPLESSQEAGFETIFDCFSITCRNCAEPRAAAGMTLAL
jgi:hypothetical protein